MRVDFPDGQWVDIKDELTQEDQDCILNSMATGITITKDGEGVVRTTLGRLPLLERSILAWSFPEPITRENINGAVLKLRYREVLLKKIDELNAEASEFRKN